MSQDWLEKLRSRPDNEKRAIAYGGAATITSMIALIWMVNMFAKYDAATQTASVGEAAGIVEIQQGIQQINEDLSTINIANQQLPITEEQVNDPEELELFRQELRERIKQDLEYQRYQNEGRENVRATYDPSAPSGGSIYNVVE